MRFMLQVRADRNTEGSIMPKKELFAAMARFNEEMVKAGVMLAADGLQPSSKGARVLYAGEERTLIDGPFKPEELIAGFWVIQVNSREEAIAWAKRAPFESGTVEIRQCFEVSDFPPEILTPEDAAREQAWREQQQKAVRPDQIDHRSAECR